MCRNEAEDILEVSRELNEIVHNPKLGGFKSEVRKPRDMVIKVNKAHLDGLDCAFEFNGECFPHAMCFRFIWLSICFLVFGRIFY